MGHKARRTAGRAAYLGAAAHRGTALGSPPDASQLRADIDAVVRHWAAQGITVGSEDALAMNF